MRDPSPPPAPRPVYLQDLPSDILLLICDAIPPCHLQSLSQVSIFWNQLLLHRVYPRRVASFLGVRTIGLSAPPSIARTIPPIHPTCSFWSGLLATLTAHPSVRTLHMCVIPLSPTDSVNSLAIEFDISRSDIFRANALLDDTHLASRRHLYVPLLDNAAVHRATGLSTEMQKPVLVRDPVLKNKYFFVVHFRTKRAHLPHRNDHTATRRETYVRELVVKLIAKGLAAHEDEVRFYLDDNNFDVAAAYKQLLRDHAFSP